MKAYEYRDGTVAHAQCHWDATADIEVRAALPTIEVMYPHGTRIPRSPKRLRCRFCQGGIHRAPKPN